MLFAMIPKYHFSEVESGSGKSTQLYWGHLYCRELRELLSFWKQIVDCAQDVVVSNWDAFLQVVRDWAYPYDCPDEKSLKLMQDFARTMALDVAAVAANHFGVLHKLKALMDRSYPELEIITNNVVSILYPNWNTDVDHTQQEEEWRRAVVHLARSWATRDPKEAAAELEPLETDMLNGRGGHYRFTPLLCNLLAEAAESPLDWFDAFAKTSLPVDTIDPFVKTAIQRGLDGWESALKTCFNIERLRASAIEISLTLEQETSEFKSACAKRS